MSQKNIMELYDLDNFHRMVTVSRALPVNFIEGYLKGTERQNFYNDKSWVQGVIMKTYGIIDFIPDPATEHMFKGVLFALMNAKNSEVM